MQHSFDVDIAKEYGILEAVLLNNLWFWIEKNKANKNNYFDGYYWTYNSTKAFNELFPYVTQRQIQNALKKLKEKEVIQTGNYNKSAYDRTLWYAFTKKGECIMQKCKMEDVEKVNGDVENVQPIPDINTSINSNSKPNVINYSSAIARLNELAGTSFKHSSKSTQDLIKARINEGYSEEDLITVIEKMCYLWNKEPKKGEKDMRPYLRPSTLFRASNFENYLNMPVQQRKVTTKDLTIDISDF